MASRILANLIVAGGSALLRAASQAYRQAIVNAQRTGVAQEAANGAAKGNIFGKKIMTIEEARQVLGVDANATYAEVYARYEKLFSSNEKNGSFYLQSKVYRAREALEGEYEETTVKAENEAGEQRANGTQKRVDEGNDGTNGRGEKGETTSST
jgi:import inner membrane translocase subunit TIM16